MTITRVRVDWSDSAHWSPELRPCRVCGTPTHGRDDRLEPCHQSCFEEELADEIDGALTPRRWSA